LFLGWWVDLGMIKRIIPLLFFLSFINAQIALPTFQAVHKPHTAEASSLYDFTTHTFTNCGATGREGPTLANCKSSYDVSWEDDTDLFNVQTQGIQEWTVPTTGTYTIEVWGAEGTDSGSSGSGDGGRGVKIKGDFSLTNGQVLKIIVGQVGLEAPYESGGGGGSYVYSNASDSYPLIAAGGGGGGGKVGDGTDGNTNTSGLDGGGSGGGSGGSDGNGGSKNTHASYSGAAGAGWLTDGEDGIDARNASYMATSGGHAPRNDGTGGDNNVIVHNPDGGFGGGGAGRGYNYAGAGGGGGYSGGGAGYHGSYGGGGGGSYNSGSNKYDSSTLGYNTSDGKVVITIN